MPITRRSRTWIWVGRIVAGLGVGAVAGYLFASGLDKADKLGSVIGAVAALVALVAPYLLPARQQAESYQTSDMGGYGGADLRHARGVQVNQAGGGVQNNNFSEST